MKRRISSSRVNNNNDDSSKISTETALIDQDSEMNLYNIFQTMTGESSSPSTSTSSKGVNSMRMGLLGSTVGFGSEGGGGGRAEGYGDGAADASAYFPGLQATFSSGLGSISTASVGTQKVSKGNESPDAKMKRIIRNRKSAKVSYQRKKQMIEQMRSSISDLQQENKEIRSENLALKRELFATRTQIADLIAHLEPTSPDLVFKDEPNGETANEEQEQEHEQQQQQHPQRQHQPPHRQQHQYHQQQQLLLQLQLQQRYEGGFK